MFVILLGRQMLGMNDRGVNVRGECPGGGGGGRGKYQGMQQIRQVEYLQNISLITRFEIKLHLQYIILLILYVIMYRLFMT